MSHEQTVDVAKHVADGFSVITLLGALVGYLPQIAALFTLIWTLLRIWENETFQKIWKWVRGK